jgi:hypothetical protein
VPERGRRRLHDLDGDVLAAVLCYQDRDRKIRVLGSASLGAGNSHNLLGSAEEEIQCLGHQRLYNSHLALSSMREMVGMYRGPDIGSD